MSLDPNFLARLRAYRGNPESEVKQLRSGAPARVEAKANARVIDTLKKIRESSQNLHSVGGASYANGRSDDGGLTAAATPSVSQPSKPVVSPLLARLRSGPPATSGESVFSTPGPDAGEIETGVAVQGAPSPAVAATPVEPHLLPGRNINVDFPQTAVESGLKLDASITLDDSQKAAIKALAKAQYGCLIGAAGTGKTTIVKDLASKIIYGDPEYGLLGTGLRALGEGGKCSIAFVAFTGIATQVIARNLPNWLRPSVMTIHTLLEFKPVISEGVGPNGDVVKTRIFLPTRDSYNRLDQDIIIVDEASMLGLELWHKMLDACRPNTRIILIGDLNQLKPVADLTMFGYALAESLRPGSPWVTAELTTIHRQKEPAANRIIETAHAVLNGGTIEFDDPGENKNWRVMGYRLKNDPAIAGKEVVTIADFLRKKNIDSSVDPTSPPVYDPYQDRIMTAGNGADESNSSSSVQQIMINDILCRLVEPPSEEHPIYVIDAGRAKKRFAVGHRVMATKNESPDIPDRVTNGMTGRVLAIRANAAWEGTRESVGPEEKVAEWRRANARIALTGDRPALPQMNFDATALARMNFDSQPAKKKEERESDGPASHSVDVRFDNGAERTFSTKAQVEQLQLAYATTVHKAQGSQCNTAIIVCHHAVKQQLNREWLYTAITRAQKRVVLLYTEFGLRTAISKQQIFGRTLAEKIMRYQNALDDPASSSRVVRLTIDGAYDD